MEAIKNIPPEVYHSIALTLDGRQLLNLCEVVHICNDQFWREKIKKMFNMSSTDEKIDHRLLYRKIYEDYKKKDYQQILYTVTGNFRYLELVKILIEKYSTNLHAGSERAFFNAIIKRDASTTKYLVEKGANIRELNDLAIILASGSDILELVKYLAEKGANVHAQNESALRYAAQHGYLSVVEYLTKEHNADIQNNTYNPHTYVSNKNAIELAIDNNRFDIIKYLINTYNIDVNAEKLLFKAIDNNNIDFIKYLIEDYKIDTIRDNAEIFISAIKQENLDILKYLLKKYKYVTYYDYLLQIAADNGTLSIVEYLVEEKKANINKLKNISEFSQSIKNYIERQKKSNKQKAKTQKVQPKTCTNVTQCKGVLPSGEKCKRTVKTGEYCWQHK